VSIATLFSAAAHHPPPQVIDTHPHAQTGREQLPSFSRKRFRILFSLI
jgi:hypothetical protein